MFKIWVRVLPWRNRTASVLHAFQARSKSQHKEMEDFKNLGLDNSDQGETRQVSLPGKEVNIITKGLVTICTLNIHSTVSLCVSVLPPHAQHFSSAPHTMLSILRHVFWSLIPPSLFSKDATIEPYQLHLAQDLPECGLYYNRLSTLDGELLAHLFHLYP